MEASFLHSAQSRCRTARPELSVQASEGLKPSVRKVWTSARKAKLELRLLLSHGFWPLFHLLAHRKALRTRAHKRQLGLVRAKAAKGSACSVPVQRRLPWARQSGSDTLARQRDFAMHSSPKVPTSNCR